MSATTPRGRKLARWAPVVLVYALVLIGPVVQVRMTDLDRFITPDETRWTCRSANFWNGLATGDLAATYQKEHPGVITMWLGGLGQEVDPEADWAVACRGIELSKLVAEAPRPALEGIRDRLFGGRLRVAIFVSLGMVVAMALLARLFGFYTALMAGALLLLDPFSIGLGRVLHVDALTSTLMLLSALALLVAQRGRPRGGAAPEDAGDASRDSERPLMGWLLISGVLAGLAALAKSPAIFLIPWAGLVLGLDAWWRGTRRRRAASSSAWLVAASGALPAAIGQALWRLLPWALAAAAAYLAAWPSMWIAPLETLQQVFGGAADYAANPHEGHNYFRGRPIEDPGPAFYAVAWWWRTTPWTLAGLALAVAGAWRGLRGGRPRLGRWRPAAVGESNVSDRGDESAHHWPLPYIQRDAPALIGLLLFALFFGIFMSLGAKKFDRYLLPAIPPLLVVAGWGWAHVSLWLGHWARTGALAKVDQEALEPEDARELRGTIRHMPLIPSLLVALGLLVGNLFHAPYYLTWFNPLAGGQAAAPETLLVGWGEGTGEPAFWLNEQPDASELEVATRYRSAFGPLFEGRALEMNKIDPATVDYYLFYINQLQRDLDPELIDRFGLRVEGAAAGTPAWWAEIERRIADGAQAPAHVTRIGDLVYALLYENRNWAPAAEAISQRADPATDVVITRADSGLAEIPLGALQIEGSDGADPGGDLEDLRASLRGQMRGPLEVVGIDADADRETILAVLERTFAEHERVWWVRYDDLIPRPGLEHADHALAVRTFETWSADHEELRVARFERPPGATDVDFTAPVSAAWRDVAVDFGDRLGLRGLRLSSEPILWGRGLDVSLRWRALDDLDANYTTFLHLIGPDGRRWAQQDRRIGDERLVPTERWGAGDGAEDTYFLTIPPATPPGEYTLLVGVYDAATGQRLVPSRSGETDVDGGVAGDAAAVALEGDTVALRVSVGRSPFAPESTLLGFTESAGGFEIVPGLSWRGYSLAAPAVAGGTVSIGMVYQAKPRDPDGSFAAPDVLRARVTLYDRTEREVGGGEFDLVPGLPFAQWQPGDLLRAWYDLPLDGRALAGEGGIELVLIDADGSELEVGSVLAVGADHDVRTASLEIDFPISGPKRSFEPPPAVLDAQVGSVGARLADVATLVAAGLAPERVAPGKTVTATLAWRAEGEPETDYQVFLHLVAPDGTIVDQRDQAPGGGERPTSSWLTGEHVVGETALVLPEGAVSGDVYALVVGLYDPADGTRLAVDVSDELKTALPSGGALGRVKSSFVLPDHRIRAATVRVR